jgi:hypothetical protein
MKHDPMPKHLYDAYLEFCNIGRYITGNDLLPLLKQVSEFVEGSQVSEIDVITKISSITYYLKSIEKAMELGPYQIYTYPNKPKVAGSLTARQLISIEPFEVDAILEILRATKPMVEECIEFMQKPVENYLALLHQLQAYADEYLGKYGLEVEVQPKISRYDTRWLDLHRSMVLYLEHHDGLIGYFESLELSMSKQGG